MAKWRKVLPLSWRPTRFWPTSTLGRRILIGIGALMVFGVVVAGGVWVRACAGPNSCPSIADLSAYDPWQASKLYAADGRLITDFYRERRTVITLDSMAPSLPAAFLAVEDKRFYDHHGVDWFGVFAAAKDALLGKPRGASTITMQLAGNRFPEDIDRRQRRGLALIIRKVKEIKVARQIEARYPKDRILELYLNQIPLGNGAFGVESASQRYFGKHASELNAAESAMLAAIPKGPTRYNPRRNPDLAVERRNVVLGLMRVAGVLTPDEAETWKAYPLALSSRSDFEGIGEYFVEYVRQQLEARYGSALYTEGYRIWTTLDLDAQAAVERAMAAQLERIESGVLGTYRHVSYREYLDAQGDERVENVNTPYLQGAAVVMEARTGNILAMVGGRDFDDSKFNRAVQAQRQPGSTFKPIVFAAALERGWSLDQIAVDTPISVPIPNQPNWEPQNYDGRFTNQPMTLREGLWQSVNSIAVQLGLQVGIPEIVEEARKFGISTRVPTVPSITLGSPDVHPIEMVAAYTVFANLGVRSEPNVILRIEDREGNLVFEAEPRLRRVLDTPTAYLLTSALRGVVTNGTANRAVWNGGFRVPSGGKTGTTNDYNNVWYIGFTNDLVAGVWMGFDQLKPIMGNAQGGRLAAPAYTQFMLEIYQRRPAPGGWAEPPDMLRTVEIDRSTGFRATPFCPRELVELRRYAPGTEPRDFCPVHSPYGPPGETD
jgi:penicillin-binding protein 1A